MQPSEFIRMIDPRCNQVDAEVLDIKKKLINTAVINSLINIFNDALMGLFLVTYHIDGVGCIYSHNQPKFFLHICKCPNNVYSAEYPKQYTSCCNTETIRE